MATNARSMRERITIKQPVYVKNSAGQRVIDTYIDIVTASPAKFLHTGGTESYHGRQLEANVIAVFEIRLPRGVEVPTTCIVEHLNAGGTEYGIVSVRPLEGKLEGGFRWVELYVRGLANERYGRDIG